MSESSGEEPDDTVKVCRVNGHMYRTSVMHGYLLVDIVQVKKSKKVADSSFFDEPPPQKSDINFTDMNLSRPLLKVCYEHRTALAILILISLLP